MQRIYFFDMDGTLIPNSSGCLEIARATDTVSNVKLLEERLLNEEIDTKDFAKELFSLWGIVEKNILDQAFYNCRKLNNIDKVLSDIRSRGDLSCLITMSPNYFARYFFDYGFDCIYSSEFPSSKEELLDINRILTPQSKLDIALELCRKNSVSLDDCVAFGDSLSDLVLFNHLKLSIAVNGSEYIRKVSRYNYQGDDLLEAYKLLDIPNK